MHQSEASRVEQIRAALIASLSIVPIWIFFSFYEKGLFYFSSIGGIGIGLLILTIGIFIAFLATLLIGIPMHSFLRNRGLSSPWYFGAAGALIPPLIVLLFGGYEQTDKLGAIVNFGGFGITGLVVALTFWRWNERTPKG